MMALDLMVSWIQTVMAFTVPVLHLPSPIRPEDETKLRKFQAIFLLAA